MSEVERQRRLRQQRKEGRALFQVELDADTVAELHRRGISDATGLAAFITAAMKSRIGQGPRAGL